MSKKYDTAIMIAADSLDALRKSDVYRVLESASNGMRKGLAEYIATGRPDLADEVAECMEEINWG